MIQLCYIKLSFCFYALCVTRLYYVMYTLKMNVHPTVKVPFLESLRGTCGFTPQKIDTK